ncbi:TadE/TadG family type IV pilus assembly protein [Nocardiopsis sp. CT-R113]|uniref:TadE/TadG family type IV pilus assembly protein n=1 Tax=Nocardiopsis codii TaxID=3065942 RepID=A0ABU7K9L7_9ACTN|nr:TadE/TadG family type IV pilus assembly protein [Nocardiopsis sp. CT-R113]MEE2038928.1 TadE/TadG family type IV pilus assembly protein [Nocardiopsis sp. CT-R113]
MNFPTRQPQRRRYLRNDAGSASVELTLLVPVLLLALVLMVVAGRQVSAALITQDAAAAAARAASLQRDPASAQTHAHQTAERELAGRGVVCARFTASADATRFAPGGTVEVAVACTVTLVDLGGFGGQRTLSAAATSPVDPYREGAP